MSDKKILSPSEALRALGDGKKLTKLGWAGYIYLDDIFSADCKHNESSDQAAENGAIARKALAKLEGVK